MITVEADECTGCMTCVDICPVEAISMNDDDVAEIDQDECTECASCLEECPVEAIIEE